MATLLLSRAKRRFHDLPLAIKSILGFWLFYLVSLLIRSELMGEGLGELFGRRMVGILLGIGLTFLVYLTLRAFAARGSLRRMVIVAALACVPASVIFSVYSFTAITLYQPLIHRQITEETRDGTVLKRSERSISIERRGAKPLVLPAQSIREILMKQAPREIANSSVSWYFFFAAWASFYVAMNSANQLRLAERRAADAERAAQSAQLRALRYQVNPHFLFNTLNSLSSLVMAKRDVEAEKMIMNLSNFFRSTLSIDPAADVSLSEEIALQMLYLDIEKARFPDRLRVEIDVPPGLENARIPALLLQPIVENAIKYGVSRARSRVQLTLRAEQPEPGLLRIVIENSGDPAAPPAGNDGSGTGVGLANVCQRLAARFGERARCHYGPRNEGGYRVTLDLPLETQ